MIKGATDYSIPESHLTEMHQLANERFAEVEEMSSTIAGPEVGKPSSFLFINE